MEMMNEKDDMGMGVRGPLGMPDKLWQGAYYGRQNVPHPTNESAKKVNPIAIVDSFTKGK